MGFDGKGLRTYLRDAGVVKPRKGSAGDVEQTVDTLKGRGWKEDQFDNSMTSPTGKKFGYGARNNNPTKSYGESVLDAKEYSDKTAENIHSKPGKLFPGKPDNMKIHWKNENKDSLVKKGPNKFEGNPFGQKEPMGSGKN